MFVNVKKVKHALSKQDRAVLGKNLLKDIQPELISFGDKEAYCDLRGDNSEHLMKTMLDISNNNHLDFWNAPLAIVYDLKEKQVASRLLISSYNELWFYALKEFEIYFSNERANLFNENNKLINEKHTSCERKGRFAVGDWLFDISGIEFRYFAIKINRASNVDDIARIKAIAIFRDLEDNQELYINKAYPNRLNQKVVSVNGNYSGNIENIIDGHAFCGNTLKLLGNDTKIIFENNSNTPISKISLIGKKTIIKGIYFNENQVDIFINKIDYSLSSRESLYGFEEVSACFETTYARFIGLEFGQPCEIDKIIFDSFDRTIEVDTSKVINDNFLGIGGNCIPTELSNDSRAYGYNEAYFELQKRRLKQLNPHICRVLLQLDWFVKDKEAYENGGYDFDTSDFISLVETVRALKEAGSEVELNIGWKTVPEHLDFMAFPECIEKGENQARASAPKDYLNFAKAGAAAVHQLFVNKKLDNIKYLTFFNEPYYLNGPLGDFGYPEKGKEKFKYWCKILSATKTELQKLNIADSFEFWGVEQACEETREIVMQTMNELARDDLKAHTLHIYGKTYDELCDLFENSVMPNSEGKQVFITELANSASADADFNYNHVGMCLAMANSGVAGGCLWILSGALLPYPMSWIHDGGVPGDGDIASSFWQYLPLDKYLDGIGESFYELSLLNRYVPIHSKVIATTGASKYSDIHFAAFESPQGDYTVAVESKESLDIAELNIKFKEKISKTFYKYVYKRPCKKSANLIVPPAVDSIFVKDKISDIISEEYSLTVYSTIPPIAQVEIDNPCVYLKAGTSVNLNAKAIDSKTSDIHWSLGECTMKGATITENGKFTMPPNASLFDTFSVKASLETGEYGVAIIRVK